MAVKPNTTMVANIDASVREIDFVTRFGLNWQSLMDILGIMRPIEKVSGTKLAAYNATVTLEDGEVAEGDEIPFSLAEVTPVAYQDIKIRKYAKAVTVEAVDKYGAATAVEKTDDAFLNELQGMVLDEFYTFLQTGTLTDSKDNFQKAIARAIGLVKDKFKKMRRDTTSIVVFANTEDIYDYLGEAPISIQTAFGIDYVENFMGADKLIITSEIPAGSVIATPVENIDLYYVNPANSDYAKLGLEYVVDGVTPLLGFKALGNYSRAIGECYALMGMALWAEYLDGIAVVSIGSGGGGSN